MEEREDPDCSDEEYDKAEAFYGQTMQMLSLLIDAIEHENKNNHLPSKRGPKPDEGLYKFIDYLRDFWCHHLNDSFTLDYHQGAGLTPAYAFIADCIAPLGVEPSPRLVTAMRRVIARSAHRISD